MDNLKKGTDPFKCGKIKGVCPLFTNMPRVARIIAPNCLYHIICRGNNQQDVFRDKDDFLRYLWLIQKYKNEHPVSIFNYVLMSNHFHMLLEPSTSHDFGAFMKKLNLAFTHYFQKKYGGIGHLWQNHFKSILVAKDSYCLACATYIELNPVAAGMAQKPEDYPWSSYSFYALGQENKIVSKNPLFEGLGQTVEECRKTYIQLAVNSWQQKKLKEDEMEKVRYLGSPEFVQQMETTIGLPNVAVRGRPRK